jgi:hypothetical protein
MIHRIIFFLTLLVIFTGCGAKEEKNIASKQKGEKLTFHIPPPSGPVTGVCDVTLTIENFFLLATETCGGHDENGHTESTEKLFNI